MTKPKKLSLMVISLFILVTGPVAAQSRPEVACDQISMEIFPRTGHFKGFSGLDVQSNGLYLSCGYSFSVSRDVEVVAGVSAMTFVNSFDVQSYSAGASLEVRYRPGIVENAGLYAGVDIGIVYGYDGLLPPSRMIGPLTPAGNFKGGVLYDIPNTSATLFAGVRFVPPVGVTGIVAPGIGMSYEF
ncbi:hypothetical protein GQE99_20490 [Maritimibacter sp. DP07]|uniref:Outer membrane protein beta-barrel domain-containing protein n=1 Tax=Maritimibacter harenae TaxID=2606218 RepID=A0A845M8Z9_9RHOB|nr:hypothetical protein [Maritimibacter harenae]MZR15398.1 hypothetical protein [Maritimibacter harenae]